MEAIINTQEGLEKAIINAQMAPVPKDNVGYRRATTRDLIERIAPLVGYEEVSEGIFTRQRGESTDVLGYFLLDKSRPAYVRLDSGLGKELVWQHNYLKKYDRDESCAINAFFGGAILGLIFAPYPLMKLSERFQSVNDVGIILWPLAAFAIGGICAGIQYKWEENRRKKDFQEYRNLLANSRSVIYKDDEAFKEGVKIE